MVIMNPQGLRQRAEFYRSLALEGDDEHLRVAFLQLAAEFEQEAEETDAGPSDLSHGVA
jgi:hypothetical protein